MTDDKDDLTPIYSSPMDVETYRLNRLDQHGPSAVNGRTRYEGLKSIQGEFDSQYEPCAEALVTGIPTGPVTSVKNWQSEGRYPETRRDIRFYLSPGIKTHTDNLELMIFNDGIGYLGRTGSVRAAQVLDTLYERGEIGPTLAIFINPGRPLGLPDELATQAQRDAADEQRSIEYDTLRPEYGLFLLEEVIPLAETTTGCRVTTDPQLRTIVGISSGGICAFTAAWQFPDQFGRVMSHCGSFTNIKGGHNYPWLIRSTPRKPIRVFLQSGANDIDGIFGHWPLANREMAAALEFAGYDFRFEFGEGGHTLAHGGSLFADALRWLRR